MLVSEGSETAGGGAIESRLGAAEYIADMTGNLATMARLHGLETLSYLLEMARLEAESSAHSTPRQYRT
jgi:hypothetical protein